MKKPLWIVLGLVVLVGGGIGIWTVARATSAAARGPRYETVAVDRGPIVAKVTATGTLSALVTVQVGSQVSGRIEEINVDFNSPVKKGQVIAQDRSRAVRGRARAGARELPGGAGRPSRRREAQAENAELQFDARAGAVRAQG